MNLSPEQTLKGSLDEKLLRVINILHIFILNMQIIYTCVYIYICSICIYIYKLYLHKFMIWSSQSLQAHVLIFGFKIPWTSHTQAHILHQIVVQWRRLGRSDVGAWQSRGRGTCVGDGKWQTLCNPWESKGYI